MSRADGGPAFARARSNDPDEYSYPEVYHAQEGLSIRDYFAAKTLSAILAQEDGGIQSYGPRSHLSATSATHVGELWAEQAYQMADFMLAERSRP